MSVEYQILGKLGEGTFSEVLKCQSIKDGSLWACKKMKQQYTRYKIFRLFQNISRQLSQNSIHTSSEQLKDIREIQALRHLSNNPNILRLFEIIL